MNPLRNLFSPEFKRLLTIGFVSNVSVAALLLICAFKGQWTDEEKHLSRFWGHIAELPADFMPVPVAFFLWIRLMNRQKEFDLSFSYFACALSIAGLVLMSFTLQAMDMRFIGFTLAVVSGFFVLAPFQECMSRVWENKRATGVAIIAGLTACTYYWLMRNLWEIMCAWTAQTVDALLRLSAFDSVHLSADVDKSTISILSPYFNILIYPDCNGLEGIFLFTFMLSVLLLLDWDIFRKKSLIFLYAFGAIYMFFMNCWRIFLFFTLGYWTNNPNAWVWVQALRGDPVYMFHSYVGWVFYLIAFGLFTGVLYSRKNEAA